MGLIDMLKKDKEKLSKLPDRKSRINFIWDYYKIPIIAFLSVLCIILISFFSNLGKAETSMYVVLINNDSLIRECDDKVFDEVLKKGGYESRKKVDVNDKFQLGRELSEDTDSDTLQVLTALFMISDLDLYVSDQYWFDYFAKEDGFTDLRYLIDLSLLEENREDIYYFENKNGQMIPVGVILRDGSLIHEAGYYHNDAFMGIVSQAENRDLAAIFVTQLLTDRK